MKISVCESDGMVIGWQVESFVEDCKKTRDIEYNVIHFFNALNNSFPNNKSDEKTLH